MPRRPLALVRLLCFVLAVAFGFALALPAGVAAAPGSTAPVARAEYTTAAEYCADAEEQAVVAQINAYRAQNGLGPVAMSQVLGAAAQHHSDDMAARNYFSHTLADGTTFAQNIRNHGYGYETLIGENLAAGNGTAAATFEQWRTSPGHNTNMLRAGFNAIGVARAFGAGTDYGWYWTTTFGGVADGAAVLCGTPPPTPSPSPSPPPAVPGANASTTSDLNLRNAADLGAAILAVMPFGSRLAVTGGAQNNFYPVVYNGVTGWAYVDFVAVDGGTPPPTPNPSPSPGGSTATVTTGLNLRTGPSTGDAVLLVMPAGATVGLTGQSANGFLSVNYNGTAGWAFADYLQQGGSPAPPPPPPAPNPGPGSGTATTTSDLNLRAGPSLGDAILMVMPFGATVTVTGGGQNGFLPVSYNGTAGWAAADYLATGGNPGGNPGGGATATVTAALNLRWGASTADGVILVMPVGAVVTRTGDAANGFAGVVYNGQFGWAYAAYLA